MAKVLHALANDPGYVRTLRKLRTKRPVAVKGDLDEVLKRLELKRQAAAKTKPAVPPNSEEACKRVASILTVSLDALAEGWPTWPLDMRNSSYTTNYFEYGMYGWHIMEFMILHPTRGMLSFDEAMALSGAIKAGKEQMASRWGG